MKFLTRFKILKEKYATKINSNAGFLRGVLWQLSDKVLRYSLNLFVGIWLARYLGPENNGIFSYAIFFSALFNSLSNFGMNVITVTEISKNPENEPQILGTSFFVMTSMNLITLIIQLVSINIIRPNESEIFYLVAIIAISSLFQPIRSVLTYRNEARVNFKVIALLSNLSFFITSVLKIIALQSSSSLPTLMIITSLESVIISILLLANYINNNGINEKWVIKKRLIMQYFKQGIPLFLSSLAIDIYMKIDIIMIGDLCSNKEAGLYAISVMLVQIWYFLPVIIYNSLYPELAKLSIENEKEFFVKLQKFYNYMAVLTLLICLPVSFLGNFIVSTLYGDSYTGAGPILSLLIWGTTFVNFGMPRNAFMYSKGLYKLQSKITITSCIINIVLNLWLIPLFGAWGATVATLIAYSYACFFSNFFYKPLRINASMMIKSFYFNKAQYI